MTKLDAIVTQQGDAPINETEIHKIMKELIHDYQPPSLNPNYSTNLNLKKSP